MFSRKVRAQSEHAEVSRIGSVPSPEGNRGVAPPNAADPGGEAAATAGGDSPSGGAQGQSGDNGSPAERSLRPRAGTAEAVEDGE